MAKSLVAATEIKHGTTDGTMHTFAAGEEIDPSLFTEQQLKDLYDAGAITIDDGSKKAEEAKEKLASGEQNKGEADQPQNRLNPNQPDVRPASAAVTAKTATGPDTTSRDESKTESKSESADKSDVKGSTSAKK